MAETSSRKDLIQKQEWALLERCKEFIFGSPDSPGGGLKDILYLTPCRRWLRICSSVSYHQRHDIEDKELSFQVNSNLAKMLILHHWGHVPPEADVLPQPGDVELLADWGDTSPEGFIPDYRPGMVQINDENDAQIEKVINRNAVLSQLKLWATAWPEPLELTPISDASQKNSRRALNNPEEYLTPCQKDILKFLANNEDRYTRVRLYCHMTESKYEHGRSTIAGALSQFVKQRLLDNSPRTSPRGYQLTGEGRLLANHLT